LKLKVFTYFLFVLILLPVASKAQVDTTSSVDTTAADTTLLHPVLPSDTLHTNLSDSLGSNSSDTLQVNRADTARTNPPDTLQSNPPDTLHTTPTDTLESAKPKITYKVRRWHYHAPLLSKTSATDSTLRWQVWLNWIEKKNRDPGVITTRLGTISRDNAMQINAHTPEYQRLYWEDISMNDPVTGIADWSYMPLHKIKNMYENDLGTVHRTTFDVKEYYLTKPLTKLKYTQSSYDTRGLEFMASYNFTRKTNAELSYWNRKGGGAYPNSKVSGNQFYGRITHILDHHQEVKLNFISNKYNNSKPFGYIIQNPFLYNFNRFNTTAVEPSGHEDKSSSILILHYYRRPDTTKPANLHLSVFMKSTKRKTIYSADTVSYKVHDFGAALHKWYRTGPLSVEGSASLDYFIHPSAGSSLNTGNWFLFNAEGKVTFSPFHFLQVSGLGNVRSRTDGYSDGRLGLRVNIAPSSLFALNLGYTTGSRMPTLQQLYWQARQYHGNTNLSTQKITAWYGRLTVNPYQGTKIGVAAYLKQINDGILIGADSSFSNSSPYSSLSTDIFAHYSSTHWELSGSATLQQFGHFLTANNNPLPVNEDHRIWFKAGAYVKGYLFKHATYVKLGLSGVISPQPYKPLHYYPSLGFWGPRNNENIPSFNRLDVDLSARLRWIMFVLRYENVLDDVTQPGYFETSGFPMPERRFIFGIRVFFRD
jgi:hypothetical protein